MLLRSSQGRRTWVPRDFCLVANLAAVIERPIRNHFAVLTKRWRIHLVCQCSGERVHVSCRRNLDSLMNGEVHLGKCVWRSRVGKSDPNIARSLITVPVPIQRCHWQSPCIPLT